MQINIEKKHFYILLAAILLGFGGLYVFAGHGTGTPNPYVPTIFHFLQDVVKGDSLVSVDENNNGKIDDSENADYAITAGSANNLACSNCVQSSEIQDGQVGGADIANNAITSAKIADGNVNTVDIANSAVTAAKIGDIGACSNICTGSISSGFCIFSMTQTGCPSGWTRESGFDSMTIRGAATPGGTGGSSTHIHGTSGHPLTIAEMPSHSHTIKARRVTWRDPLGISPRWTATDWADDTNAPTTSVGGNAAHTHGNTDSADSWPPYRNVIVCCKN